MTDDPVTTLDQDDPDEDIDLAPGVKTDPYPVRPDDPAPDDDESEETEGS